MPIPWQSTKTSENCQLSIVKINRSTGYLHAQMYTWKGISVHTDFNGFIICISTIYVFVITKTKGKSTDITEISSGVQPVLGVLCPKAKVVETWNYTAAPPYVFKGWHIIAHTDNLT